MSKAESLSFLNSDMFPNEDGMHGPKMAAKGLSGRVAEVGGDGRLDAEGFSLAPFDPSLVMLQQCPTHLIFGTAFKCPRFFHVVFNILHFCSAVIMLRRIGMF